MNYSAYTVNTAKLKRKVEVRFEVKDVAEQMALGSALEYQDSVRFDICRKLVSEGWGPAGGGSDLICFHLKAEIDKVARALQVDSMARLRE